ncbi:alpha/beta hydrolase [Fulvimarina sp. MAC3]|uniref:alpha/beta fold hydrolase n=1 Tax=Fulvimarina sp. MAC3 TaxID=3148887 RepID=UPI0031FC016B
MFENFETRMIEGEGAEIFVRTAGKGPPLLLLHGYPQTGAMWHGLAPRLAEDFAVVVPDLRGYGRSSAPANDAENHAYSKRMMGLDMLAVMRAFGHETFMIAGHDRGGRVGYRMALDHPDAVTKLSVLDIVPVAEVWERMDAAAALKTYHWPFFAQPHPMPETLIGADPVYFLEHTMASWTKAKDLSAFAGAAMDEYRDNFRRPAAIEASCNDYRAGATIDWRLDRENREAGRRIACPTQALWGASGIPAGGADLVEIWRHWCEIVEGEPVDAGHFIVEEAPEETYAALSRFLRG